MATWDVFHSDRLEVERSLSTAAIQGALVRGELHEDDLARPAGTTAPWARLADIPALMAPGLPLDDEQAAPEKGTDEIPLLEADDEDEEAPPAGGSAGAGPVAEDAYEPPVLPDKAEDLGEFDVDLAHDESKVALPADGEVPGEHAWEHPVEEYDHQDEDEEAAEFTLSRTSAPRVEELDLAAMVDVAFQMVLFFMVTATSILFKTLEVPRTPPEPPPGAVAQGQQHKTLDDLKNDFIIVEVNPQGEIRIDHEPASPESLVERLRKARRDTGRTAMLLSADFATPHRNAVLTYDAANEIGLRIAIAKPGTTSG